MSQYFKIGKLAASHGLKGELILQHQLENKTAFKDLEVIFIEDKKESFIPYFIEKASSKSISEAIIKLEGIDTMEIARKLTPKDVWLESKDFHKYVSKNSTIALLGYSIISKGKNIGEIVEITEMPHQILCTLIINTKEVLIPVHEQNLVKIDNKNKTVYVEIPDGLIEIYM